MNRTLGTKVSMNTNGDSSDAMKTLQALIAAARAAKVEQPKSDPEVSQTSESSTSQIELSTPLQPEIIHEASDKTHALKKFFNLNEDIQEVSGTEETQPNTKQVVHSNNHAHSRQMRMSLKTNHSKKQGGMQQSGQFELSQSDKLIA